MICKGAFATSLQMVHLQISDVSVECLEASRIWKVENEFYEFAEAQFKAVKAELLSNNEAMQQHFNYDKIRPKA